MRTETLPKNAKIFFMATPLTPSSLALSNSPSIRLCTGNVNGMKRQDYLHLSWAQRNRR